MATIVVRLNNMFYAKLSFLVVFKPQSPVQVVGLHQSQHRTSPDPSNNTELTATEGDHVTFR